MSQNLLSKGIYAIINKELNLVYIGETQRNFLIRWIEHLIRIPDHVDNLDRTKLFLHTGTKFIILKKMDEPGLIRKDFFLFEHEAYEFYKKRNWGIVSTHNYNLDAGNDEGKINEEKILERYRKAVNHIALFISTKNTNHQNGSLILSTFYKQIDKKFSTDVRGRGGKSVLRSLTKEEMEYILLDVYPRFYQKKLHVLREELKMVVSQQISLF